MEFKGTKGKWRLVTNDESHLFGGLDNYNKIVAGCGYYDINEPNLGFSISGYISKENSLLISRAPEMLEKLSEIVNILDIKCTDGCVNKTWRDFQNGNGEDVGLEIDKFIKATKQLIKEATEL